MTVYSESDFDWDGLAERMQGDDYTLTDYTMLCYPRPNPNQEDYRFYQMYGYDQWLIHTYGYDFEQLKIGAAGKYNALKVGMFFKQRGATEDNYKPSMLLAMQGLPLVRTTARTGLSESGMASVTVAKGDVGMVLWETDNGYYCHFPHHDTFFGMGIGDVNRDRLVKLDEMFTTEERFIELVKEVKHPVHTGSCTKEFVKIPGFAGVWYVDHAHGQYDVVLWVIPAVPKLRGKGYKKVASAKRQRIDVTSEDFENIIIL